MAGEGSASSQVNALYAKLAENGRRDGNTGLSPMTIHHVHSCLHKACKDAVRWGHISRNLLDAADPPRKKGEGTKEMRTWTKEQLGAFLKSVADERLSPSLAHNRHDGHAQGRGHRPEMERCRPRGRTPRGTPRPHP